MFPGRSRVGLEAEARPVVPDGFVEFPLQAKTDGQVAMGIGVPRVDLDHLAQVRDRFTELVARTEQHGEIEVRIGIVRIQPYGATELGDRRVRNPPGRRCRRIATA